MKIGNFDALASAPGRREALLIAEAGLEAIDTGDVIRRNIRLEGGSLFVGGKTFPLADAKRIFVVAIGKCAPDAAAAAAAILKDNLAGGIIFGIREAEPLPGFRIFTGTHPAPSETNTKGAEAVRDFLSGMAEGDLIIFLISGGGSTLLCLPQSGTCTEESLLLTALTRSGARIEEINTVRKHLSLARGGYLAKYAYPASGVALIFSDVPGDNAQYIASGPTIMDSTSVADAEAILKKYRILESCGLDKCGLVETPKESKYFEKIANVFAVSNSAALAAMKKTAEDLGWKTEIKNAAFEGEASALGRRIIEELHGAMPGSAFLYGGESTVTIKGSGKGGRNLEMALAGLDEVLEDELLLTLASDGRDNQPEFAGALCDIITAKAASAAGVSPKKFLAENDSYGFFKKIGNAIETGDTGSNVSDLLIALKYKK